MDIEEHKRSGNVGEKLRISREDIDKRFIVHIVSL